MEVKHAITIDVEDYYHVSALSSVISPEQWSQWPSRVENNTLRLLDLLDSKQIRATFFILGTVAEKHPVLVKRIQQRGHELASHGYSHQLIYKQAPSTFHDETLRAKKLLEDISGVGIYGYRAASYSITRDSLWALDILATLGFTWDSSIFPVWHDNYGIPGSPRTPYTIITQSGRSIREFPLCTARLGPLNIPVAGGGYFRLYPYHLFRYLFRSAIRQTGQPCVFYLHPWEIDVDQPKVSGLTWLSRFRHYRNLNVCFNRLNELIGEFPFTSIGECLNHSSGYQQTMSESQLLRAT